LKIRNTISVFEHERLTIHDNGVFTKKHLKSLINFNDNNNNKYFTVIRDGVKFSQYVGVLQAGNLTIEILPKADKDSIVEQATKPVWRSALLGMLQECKLLRVDEIDKAELNLRSNSILEIYLEIFLLETQKILRKGLVKKYMATEGNRMSLKGRLNFGKQIAQNIIHQERFYIHFSEYSNDNIYNRLLLKTLRLIPKINSNPALADSVNTLLLNFPELPDCKVSSATFEQLTFDRKLEPYREALLISKMLLLNYRPDISGGTENVIAVLFDINKLWEEFIYRRLKKYETSFGISVKRQQTTGFWKPGDGNNSKTVRPDIVMEYGKQQIVIDTKWKILKGLIPSDDDLKQIFIYNLFWNCDRSVLLYPANSEDSGQGDYHDHNNGKLFSRKCCVEKIMILKDNKLKKNLGQEIIEKVLGIKEVIHD